MSWGSNHRPLDDMLDAFTAPPQSACLRQYGKYFCNELTTSLNKRELLADIEASQGFVEEFFLVLSFGGNTP